MNIIPPLLRKLYAPHAVALSVAEFESLLSKGIAESKTDNDLDACIEIIKRYCGISPACDAAIRRLNRGILLQRLRINRYRPNPLRPLKGELKQRLN